MEMTARAIETAPLRFFEAHRFIREEKDGRTVELIGITKHWMDLKYSKDNISWQAKSQDMKEVFTAIPIMKKSPWEASLKAVVNLTAQIIALNETSFNENPAWEDIVVEAKDLWEEFSSYDMLPNSEILKSKTPKNQRTIGNP